MTLNELEKAFWASRVCIHISGQKDTSYFKGMAAACAEFGERKVVSVYSMDSYFVSITLEAIQ